MWGVLVAISIPIFTAQLEKSKEATDLANVRSAYAEAVSAYLSEGETGTYTVSLKSDISNVKSSGDVAGVDVADILDNATCTIVVGAGGSATINGKPAKTTIGTKS